MKLSYFLLQALLLAPVLSQAGELKVEIKKNIEFQKLEEVLSKLNLKDSDADNQQIYFFDDPAQSFYKCGVLLRARAHRKKESDMTVKIKNLKFSDVNSDLLKEDGFKCEMDSMGNGDLYSCSFSRPVSDSLIEKTVKKEKNPNDLLSKKQKTFLSLYGFCNLPVASSSSIGVVRSKVWQTDEFLLELWLLEEDVNILEISKRISQSDYISGDHSLDKFIEDHGLKSSKKQTSKTKVVMDYFATHH